MREWDRWRQDRFMARLTTAADLLLAGEFQTLKQLTEALLATTHDAHEPVFDSANRKWLSGVVAGYLGLAARANADEFARAVALLSESIK